jgi:hypothetical protein
VLASVLPIKHTLSYSGFGWCHFLPSSEQAIPQLGYIAHLIYDIFASERGGWRKGYFLMRTKAATESKLKGVDAPVEGCVNSVFVADSTKPFAFLQDETVHLILSDIPYGIGAEDWDVLHANTNSA